MIEDFPMLMLYTGATYKVLQATILYDPKSNFVFRQFLTTHDDDDDNNDDENIQKCITTFLCTACHVMGDKNKIINIYFCLYGASVYGFLKNKSPKSNLKH